MGNFCKLPSQEELTSMKLVALLVVQLFRGARSVWRRCLGWANVPRPRPLIYLSQFPQVTRKWLGVASDPSYRYPFHSVAIRLVAIIKICKKVISRSWNSNKMALESVANNCLHGNVSGFQFYYTYLRLARLEVSSGCFRHLKTEIELTSETLWLF